MGDNYSLSAIEHGVECGMPYNETNASNATTGTFEINSSFSIDTILWSASKAASRLLTEILVFLSERHKYWTNVNPVEHTRVA